VTVDSIVVRPSCAAEIAEVAAPLVQAHYEEIARHKRVMELAPDWTRYFEMERAGLLLALVAWVNGDMVGYSVTLFGHHLHYKRLFYAQNDVLFVASPHRRSRVGLLLIRETEKQARESGARMMLWHAKPDTALEAIMPRLGYQTQDVIFSKEL
jgi:GNAT superfamily N-acetyltransferase